MRIRRSAQLVLFGTLVVGGLVADAMALAVQDEAEDAPLRLILFASSRAGGELVLEWTGGPPGIQRWQYRYKGPSIPAANGVSGERLPAGGTERPAYAWAA